MVTREFDLDLIPGKNHKEIHLSQYDTDFRLLVSLFSSDGTFSLENGTTAAIRGTKPDGNGYSADCSLDIATGIVTIEGHQQMTSVAGKSVYELTLYKDGKELSTVNFFLIVERAAMDKDTIVSDSKLRELILVEDNAEEIISAAQAIEKGERIKFDEGLMSMLGKKVNGVTVLQWGSETGTLTDGKSVKYATGELIDSATGAYSIYMELPDHAHKIYYNRLMTPAESTASGMAFYDAGKNYISGIPNISGAKEYSAVLYGTEIPDEAAYARFTYAASNYARRYPPFYVSVIDDYEASIDNRVNNLERLFAGLNLPFYLIDDMAVRYNDGVVVPSMTGQSVTDYIELPTNAKTLFYKRLTLPMETVSTGMAFYDSDKNYLSGIPHKIGSMEYGSELFETMIPKNAVYARFSYVKLRSFDRYGPFIVYVAFENNISGRVSNVEDAVYCGYKDVDLTQTAKVPYSLALYGRKWGTLGDASYCVISLDGGRFVKIQTGATRTRYIFLTDAGGIEDGANAHVPEHVICQEVGPYSTETIPVPDCAAYVCIWATTSDGTVMLPQNVRIVYDDEEEKKKKLIFAPVFNLNLANANNYVELSGYDSDSRTIPSGEITGNGLVMNNGFEYYVTINKYIVCDDVSYRANITLSEDCVGSCALGTADMDGAGTDPADKPHATIVVFDFKNARVRFKTGINDTEHKSCHDGKSMPVDDYHPEWLPDEMVNLSGTHYRIEIGRKKRCPYAAVYNLTTGKTCYYAELQVYATEASYGGKAGALYDLPTFAALSGAITFERVAAFVPTDVAVAFLGDSNTEGSQMPQKGVWANQVIAALNGDGLNMGRGGGTVKHMIKCAEDLLPVVKPKYVVVTIGSNGTSAPDGVNTLANFNLLKDRIDATGAIPIFNVFPRGKQSATNTSLQPHKRTQMILAQDTEHVRFDIATSEGNDLNNNQNKSFFFDDEQHLNQAGSKEVYNAFMATVGWQLS